MLPLESWQRRASFAGAVGLQVDRVGAASRRRAARAHVLDGEQWPVRRSLVVGGRLVTVSDAGIEQNSLTSLAEEAWLAFP